MTRNRSQAALAVAVATVGAMALAACNTTSPRYPTTDEPRPTVSGEAAKPNFPVRPEAAPGTPPAPDSEGALPPARSSGTVESRPLDAPLPPTAAPTTLPPAVAATPPAAPVTTTETRTLVTGRVVDADGPPRVHTVKPGEGLDAVARALGSTRQALAAANDLEPPYNLKPGQKIKGPSSKAKAYVVQSGDTLFAISQRFGVTAAAIAEANDMKVETPIGVGKRLILPSGYKDGGPIRRTVTVTVPAPAAPPPTATVQRPPPPPVATPPATTAAAPPPVARPTPPPQTATRPPVTAPPVTPPATTAARPPVATPPPAAPPLSASARPPATTTPPASTAQNRQIIPSTAMPLDAEVSTLGKGRFVWPVKGDVISEFGPKSAGQRNDGLNIRAPAGSVVRAAAGGEVAYAGNEVPGFGNLVLLRHPDGWVTAYAHLGKVSVQMRQTVGQNQEIGQAGSTGGVSEPQVHFEVRYQPSPADRPRPVDPRLVLPRN